MKRRLYGIYDLKAEALLNGILTSLGNDAEAARMFRTVVTDPQNFVSSHPGDFGLCFVGEIDYDTLIIDRAKAPHIPILLGTDVLREIERARGMDKPEVPALVE